MPGSLVMEGYVFLSFCRAVVAAWSMGTVCVSLSYETFTKDHRLALGYDVCAQGLSLSRCGSRHSLTGDSQAERQTKSQ